MYYIYALTRSMRKVFKSMIRVQQERLQCHEKVRNESFELTIGNDNGANSQCS